MVNNHIGEQWGNRMNEAAQVIMGRIPVQSHPIWRNDFRFVMQPPEGTS